MSDRKHLELGKDQFPRCVVTEKSRVPGKQKNVTTGTLVPFSTGYLEIDSLGCLIDKIGELGGLVQLGCWPTMYRLRHWEAM